jgi:hypothetical protein
MLEDRVHWITKNGKKILIMDYVGLKIEQIKEVIGNCYKAYENQQPKSVLSITDLTNTFLTKSVFDAFKEMDAKTNKYDLKTAVVGLNIAKRVLLNLINKFNKSEIKGFNSREEAIAWLIK